MNKSLTRIVALVLISALLGDSVRASATPHDNVNISEFWSINRYFRDQALSPVLSSGERHFRQFFAKHAGRTFGSWGREFRAVEASRKNDSVVEFVAGIFLTPPSLQTRAQRYLRIAFGVASFAVLLWDAANVIGGAGVGPEVLASLGLFVSVPDSPITHLAKRPWALEPLSKPALPSHPFYSHLLVGVGELNPDWARREVVAETILEVMEQSGSSSFTIDEIQGTVAEKLINQRIPLMGVEQEHMRRLLGSFEELEIIQKTKTGNRYRFAKKDTNIDPKAVAMKFKLVGYIGERLEAAVTEARTGDSGARSALLKMITEYGEVAERWPTYPLESRWSFLVAVTFLDKEDQEYLVDLVSTSKDPRTKRLLRDQYPLFDAMWLMIAGLDPKADLGKDWVPRQAPHVIGHNQYLITPEGWLPAGGLGRVIQFLSAGMARLAGIWFRVATIEPYYIEDVTPEVAKNIVPVGKIERFPLPGSNEVLTLEVFKYVNNKGVDAYLIKDVGRDGNTFFTRKRYYYKTWEGYPSEEAFSNFFNHACLALIAKLEKEKLDGMIPAQGPYKYPGIISNDGQTGMFAKITRDLARRDDSDLLIKSQPFLRALARNATFRHKVHSYKHLGPTIEGRRTAAHGLTYSDSGEMVAATHLDERGPWFPMERITAMTNIDDREATRSEFLKIWNELFPSQDAERPTPEQLVAVNEEAKRRFTVNDPTLLKKIGLDPSNPHVLNPKQLVIAVMCRCVTEKVGLERAHYAGVLEFNGGKLDRGNLEFLVSQGVQVVLYANVQDSDITSAPTFALMEEVARELNTKRYDGKILTRSGWTIDDQRKLMPAANFSTQDSDRETEAAGKTEVNIDAVGGNEIAPPYQEGILNRTSSVARRPNGKGKWHDKYGGNLWIPNVDFPARANLGDPAVLKKFNEACRIGYLNLYAEIIDLFKTEEGRRNLAMMGPHAVRQSWVLGAPLGAAEQLRQIDADIERKENPLEAVRECVMGEPGMITYFRKPWNREALVTSLELEENKKYVKPVYTSNGDIKAYVVHLPKIKPFLVAIDTDPRMWEEGTTIRQKAGIYYKRNEEAFTILFQGRIPDPGTAFQFWDPTMRELYGHIHHMEDADGREGLYLGIPYPGIQILVPRFLEQPLARGEETGALTAKGLEIQLPSDDQPTLTAYFRNIPDYAGRILKRKSSLQQTLNYLGSSRPPVETLARSAMMQVPIRFLGGWTETLGQRLEMLVDMMHLPAGTKVHLSGPYESEGSPPIQTEQNFMDGLATWQSHEDAIVQVGHAMHQRRMKLIIDAPHVVSLDLMSETAKRAYVDAMVKMVEVAHVDGFQVDWPNRGYGPFWVQVEKELNEAAWSKNRKLVFIHKNPVDPEIEPTLKEAGEMAQNIYYGTTLFSIFKVPGFNLADFKRAMNRLAPQLQSGNFASFLSVPGELSVVGRLWGGLGTAGALTALAAALPGVFSFPFWDALGWEFRDRNGQPRVINPDDSAAELQARSEAESQVRKVVLPEFRTVLQALDHEVFRDGTEILPLTSRSETFVSFARPYVSKTYGKELGVFAVNLSEQAQTDHISFPLECLGVDDDEEHYFVLYDLLSKRLYFHTDTELRHLRQEFKPGEARAYLVREIVEPTDEIKAYFAASRKLGGMQGVIVMTTDGLFNGNPISSVLPWTSMESGSTPQAGAPGSLRRQG